jgi:hypothetical protein
MWLPYDGTQIVSKGWVFPTGVNLPLPPTELPCQRRRLLAAVQLRPHRCCNRGQHRWRIPPCTWWVACSESSHQPWCLLPFSQAQVNCDIQCAWMRHTPCRGGDCDKFIDTMKGIKRQNRESVSCYEACGKYMLQLGFLQICWLESKWWKWPCMYV